MLLNNKSVFIQKVFRKRFANFYWLLLLVISVTLLDFAQAIQIRTTLEPKTHAEQIIDDVLTKDPGATIVEQTENSLRFRLKEQYPQAIELLDKRTENSKTHFIETLPDGKQRFVLDSSIGDTHYKDNPDNPEEPWKEIDTEIQPATDPSSGYDYQNITNNFKSFFKKESTAGQTVRYEYNGSFITFTLEDNELGKINRVEGFAKDNQFIYPNAFDNVDVKYSIGARVLLEEFVLYRPKDSAKISQRVHFEDAEYQEQEDGSINFYSIQTNEPIWSFPKLKMYELNEREDENGLPTKFENFGLHYEITKDGNDYIVTKVLDQEGKDWLNSPERVYPLVIDTTLDLQVGAEANDDQVFRLPATYWSSAGVVVAGYSDSDNYAYGSAMRFTSVSIPQGATINVAYLTLTAYATRTTAGVKSYLNANDVDNATAPTSYNDHIGKARTADVLWDNIESWTANSAYNSVSIVSPVQTVINRAGWVSGNALMIFWEDRDARSTTNANTNRLGYSYGLSSVNAPKLHIEYTADITAPTVSTLSPVDNAIDVLKTANLVITFSEAVDAEAGASNDIVIKKTSDSSTVETIDAQDAKVTGSGTATITINPATVLDYVTGYYVQIGADAFDDAAGNSFAGISDTTSWNFTTAIQRSDNYLESVAFDTESSDGFAINSIYWEGTIATESVVGFQFAVATSTDFSGVDFLGVDGSVSTIYNATNPDGGEAISVNSLYHHPFESGYRYFRYRVYLDKTSESPEVTQVSINWTK